MKRLLLLTFLIPTILYGQDSTSTKYRKFFIGVNFSPDYCYRNITKNDNSISSDEWAYEKNYSDSIYKPTFGYTTGLNFYYQVRKWYSIESGIQYSRKGYQTIPLPTGYHFEITTIYYYFTYLDVPLQANFTFLKSKIQIIVSTGAIFSYLLHVGIKYVPQTQTADFQTQTHISKYSYNKINISPSVSVGLKYNVNNRINLCAQPTFRYGILNPDSKSAEFMHLWSLGFNISFNYGL